MTTQTSQGVPSAPSAQSAESTQAPDRSPNGQATQRSEATYDHPATRGGGWRAFAGVMIMLGGLFNLVDGVVAITRPHYYVQVSGNYVLLVTANLDTWGWVAIGVAVLMMATGAVVMLTPWLWARVVGVVVASFNALFQLAFLAHYPLWSIIMILVDVLVIYGLVVPVGAERA